MARTRKQLFKQNLNAVPVLIEDDSQESVYFSIKQLDSYFTGGRNAFLITGTGLLEPNTDIFIEILDVNGNPVYLEAIKNFSEAGSRVISVEVYENTPRGPAVLTILGTARQFATGNTIPNEWKGIRNIRWQKKLIIEPKSKNVTPIRIKTQPQIVASELLLTGSLVSQSIINQNISNFVLQPKFELNKQKGYIISNDCNTIQFKSYHLSPKITGSFTLERRKYTGTIPATTETYVVLESTTASLNLPLDLLNVSRSFTDINITGSDGQTINLSPLSNGQYELSDTAFTSSATQYNRYASNITASVKYSYVSESATLTSGSVFSFAKLRIINLDTFSGQIFRVKTSVKQAGSQTDFGFVADTPTTVGELLITSSADQDDREQPIGKFNTQAILTASWYAHKLTGSLVPDQSYADDTVNAVSHISLSRNEVNILDAAYAITSESSYFVGTRQDFELFPSSEYTLKFDSYVYTNSSSYAHKKPYTLDVYLTGSAIVSRDILGQKIGTITTQESVAYFPNNEFNFRIARSGSAGVRFVVNNGYWEFANVSLKVAEEYAFSPDEVIITVPNNAERNSSLIFKTELFDLNNNALNLNIQSVPIFFSGSILPSVGTGFVTSYIFDGGTPSSSYTLGPAFDCGGVT